jgi:hypothetical protein
LEIADIKPGMNCTLSDGSLVEVKGVLPDRIHVQVKYIDSLDNPEIPEGSEGQVPYEELIAEYRGAHAEGLT